MAPPPRRFQLPIFSDAAAVTSMYDMLFHAAYDGDLRHFKTGRLVRALDKGRGRLREAVEAARLDGVGALHVAAVAGSLEVCSYMVEGLRVGVDPVDDEGRTPLFCAIEGENVEVVKYLLNHGANQDKADHEGQTPLHSAAAIGDCEMVELLIAKGAYVDPVAVGGTPLHVAATKGQDSTMKILLEHNADCNKMDMIFGVTPLFAAINVGSVKCVKLLVEAGADINEDCMFSAFFESMNGLDVSSECLNFLLETTAAGAEHANKGKIAKLKSLGSEAVETKDYPSASEFYTKAMDLDPDDASLFSNRSLCWLRMGDGQKALLDARECRRMRPDWPKACYRQGAALMLLKDYGSACEALFDGFKLDPENADIEHALREAMESLKISQGNKVK
ncbi:unnamed protein product [Urochloa decumbens]|uniref:Uncharacterized protein n=1 Tax=Urochloa decumbens TaxID=240449 RepID=A0ABC8ZWW1_9POAL